MEHFKDDSIFILALRDEIGPALLKGFNRLVLVCLPLLNSLRHIMLILFMGKPGKEFKTH